jgi:hypothetical protein
MREVTNGRYKYGVAKLQVVPEPEVVEQLRTENCRKEIS